MAPRLHPYERLVQRVIELSKKDPPAPRSRSSPGQNTEPTQVQPTNPGKDATDVTDADQKSTEVTKKRKRVESRKREHITAPVKQAKVMKAGKAKPTARTGRSKASGRNLTTPATDLKTTESKSEEAPAGALEDHQADDQDDNAIVAEEGIVPSEASSNLSELDEGQTGELEKNYQADVVQLAVATMLPPPQESRPVAKLRVDGDKVEDIMSKPQNRAPSCDVPDDVVVPVRSKATQAEPRRTKSGRQPKPRSFLHDPVATTTAIDTLDETLLAPDAAIDGETASGGGKRKRTTTITTQSTKKQKSQRSSSTTAQPSTSSRSSTKVVSSYIANETDKMKASVKRKRPSSVQIPNDQSPTKRKTRPAPVNTNRRPAAKAQPAQAPLTPPSSQASQTESLALVQVDPDLLRLSQALTRREPIDAKPLPQGQPLVWADSRQALTETLPYFKKPQGGCHQNDRHAYAFLFDNVGHSREYMDADVIIAKAGGCMEEDKSTSKTGPNKYVQSKNQLMTDAQVQAVLNDVQLRNPIIIIIGDKNPGSATKMPHKYCVLGWYKPVRVWAEKTIGRGKKAYTTIKYRFERLQGSGPAWHAPKDDQKPATVTLAAPVVLETCSCGEQSPQVYLEGWMCLSPACAHFWQIDGHDASALDLHYNPAFLLSRTSWDQGEVEPYSVRPALPEFGKNIGDNLSYINTRGVCCPECGRCNPRYLFWGWRCDNPECSWTLEAQHKPVMPAALHMPWDAVGDGPSLARNKHEAGVKANVSYTHHYKVYTYTFEGIDGRFVHAVANSKINQEPEGPDAMLAGLQTQDMGLERRRFNSEKGSGSKTEKTTPNKAKPQATLAPHDIGVQIASQLPQTSEHEPSHVSPHAGIEARDPFQGQSSVDAQNVAATPDQVEAPKGAAHGELSLESPTAPAPGGKPNTAGEDRTQASLQSDTLDHQMQGSEVETATEAIEVADIERVPTQNTPQAEVAVEDDTTPRREEAHEPESGSQRKVCQPLSTTHIPSTSQTQEVSEPLEATDVTRMTIASNEDGPRTPQTSVPDQTQLLTPPSEVISRPVEAEAPPEEDVDPMQPLESGDFMTAFSMNYGMPYKFVASGASKPFRDAPWPVRASRSRLNWAARTFLADKETVTDFNEELIFAYMERQKIEYHDDGEEGLGPRIATLSLGGKARMHMRMKRKYYVGCSKTGLLTAERPVPGVLGGKEMYEKRLQAWTELEALKETDRPLYQKRLREIPKELGIFEKKTKEAQDLVTITLNHGDIVIMEGYDIQKYLEHKVVPEGYLRFALTCRTVLEHHLKPEERPEGGVPPDDYGYNGEYLK